MASQGGSEIPGQKGGNENISKTVWDARLRWVELHPFVPALHRVLLSFHGSPPPGTMVQRGSREDHDLFLAQISPSSNKYISEKDSRRSHNSTQFSSACHKHLSEEQAENSP